MTAARQGRRLVSYLALVVGAALAGLGPCAQAQTEVKGKYMVISCPAAENAMATRLAKLGDSALDMYAKDLGAQVPAQPFKVFLYGTIGDYEKAEEPRTHGQFKGNLAFTHRDTCDILMYIQPRPGRPDGQDSGMMEALFTHELVHALCYRLYPSYEDFPNWLSEGMADAWSERAIAGGDSYCAEKSPWFSEFILDVRQALEDGRYIPVEKLETESTVGHDFAYRQLRYAECFSLVRFLDTPGKEKGEPERRAKFRTLLKEACALPKAGNVTGKINDRFAEIFGSTTILEREFVHTVMAEPTFPWQIQFREIRALPDGILCETFPENTALAFSTKEAVGPIARVQAEVDVADLGHRQANLVFGGKGRDSFYLVAFAPGTVTLMRYLNGQWEKPLLVEKIDPGIFGPGKHLLQVDIDCNRLWAKIDQKSYLHAELPDGVFGKGRWGIGAYDARVVFRNAQGLNK